MMARAARGVATMMKWAMAKATTWVMVTMTRVEGNKEGNGKEKGKGGKSNGDGYKGGGQAMVTTPAMAIATQKAVTRAAREIAMAMTMAGNIEDNGKGGKGNGNSNYNGG